MFLCHCVHWSHLPVTVSLSRLPVHAVCCPAPLAEMGSGGKGEWPCHCSKVPVSLCAYVTVLLSDELVSKCMLSL